MKRRICLFVLLAIASLVSIGAAATSRPLEQAPNTWVKRSPLAGTPASPRLGYEGAVVWDGRHGVLIRYGGHNQGGGGEQGSEVWTYEPLTAKWTLKEPNLSPPGLCCAQQHIFEPLSGRYVRFASFSGSHGWQWWREIYLNDSPVWTYDLETNLWRDMRPVPAPHVSPLRCASWDSDAQVIVVFGGEGNQEGTLVYDPYANTWTRKHPSRRPEFRSGGNMAYGARAKLHVLFGAQFTDDPLTWAYDLPKDEWRELTTDGLPPTNQNDAVLAYDAANGVVVALIKVSQGKEEKETHRIETWALNTAENRWTKMNPNVEPDPSGNRVRVLAFVPEFGLTFLENCTHPPHAAREQQIWTYCYGRPKEPPAVAPARTKRTQPRIVEDVTASVLSTSSVVLSWPSSPDPNLGRYVVERAPVEVWSEDQLVRLKKNTPPLAEPSVGAIAKIGAFARIGEPVPAKGEVKAYTFADSIDLTKPALVAGEPSFDRKMYDEQLDRGGKPYRFAVYAYRVRAVNAAGEESGPSPYVLTIPSSPQWLFSKEDGKSGRLKWAANPEQAIQGYRVYRLDGRYDNEPVSRLTAEPISATTFTDATAGDKTRRYYVVAVDAIGQEGYPSSPVWFDREWKQYYKPFIGEWHQ
jgi:hypothetical protein